MHRAKERMQRKDEGSMETSISSVLAYWNLGEVKSVEAFHTDKYRCSGNAYLVECRNSRFVLKRIAGKNTLSPIFTILLELHKRGLPVAAPVPTRFGELTVFHTDNNYYLTPFLTGSVMEDHFHSGFEQRSHSFGRALAKLHAALRQISVPGSLKDMNLLGQVQVCETEVRARGMNGAIIITLTETVDALRRLAPLPTQLIHRDAHAANVLFTDNEVSGWLDFELTTIGPRLFDLCYYSTSLLMNALHDAERSELWFSVLRNLVSGYQEVDRLTENECAALPYVLLAIEAVFIAYSLRIDDSAGVMQNLHALAWLHGNIVRVRRVIEPQI